MACYPTTVSALALLFQSAGVREVSEIRCLRLRRCWARLATTEGDRGGVFSVARFTAKITGGDGQSYDMPAEICLDCKGIGCLTAPLTYESRRRGEDNPPHPSRRGRRPVPDLLWKRVATRSSRQGPWS